MPKKTPNMGTTGRYTLRDPWVTVPGIIYTCIAIRSFEDILKRGRDVYTDFYVPKGLVSGTEFNGSLFQFSQEAAQKPNIITLKGSDGSTIYVPDTYIDAYPEMGNVQYQRVAFSIDLGSLPDYLSLDSIRSDIEVLVSTRFGKSCIVKEHKLPSIGNITNEEHEAAEAARIGSITLFSNIESELVRAKDDLALYKAREQALINILRDNNLLPDGT